ncbi:helix-turn-helix transcriptional regulator [Cellulomonas alba]|uniref:AAA family ATPase n=1 Tax=Cellulomonas alba TaxID=3053467 RepID=A0ABT7SGK6_9CELL|nr:LuxR family transcriptional regulator [Cellulomonas alba]MDM7855306.1 AAA family ATPase [Cellulomonas alba]
MSTPFVAREAQVAQLEAALARAGGGEPSAVLLAGDAGVGKTRLLLHVAETARTQGVRVVVSHCVDLGEIGVPYLPFADALVQLREVDPEAVDAVVAERPALARLLPGAAAPPAPDDQTGRLQLFDGFVEAACMVGRPGRPLLLVIEDLHWADASSRDLLRFAVARLRDQHVVVVASYRTDDLHRRHPWRPLAAELARHPRVERLELAPFAPDELRAFATAVAGRPLGEAALRGVAERSEGNAYFAEELIEAGPEPALPWSLAEVVRARVDGLDPAVQHVARIASTAGRRVAEPLLRAAVAADASPLLAEPGAVDAALREAVAHQVLVGEQGEIAFRHALLAEAVYGDLLPGEQSALHRAYLVALTAEPSLGRPSQLAAHALRAPDLPVALAASRSAAEEAHRLLAPAEELRHLEVVLRLWDAVADAGEDRIAVLMTAATAASAAGQVDRAMQLTRAAVDATADDPGRQAALRCDLARRLLDVERPRDALREAQAAVAGLVGPSAARAWGLATVARSALNLDLDTEARDAAVEAIAVAREVDAADAESDAVTTLAVLDAEDPEKASRLLREALETVRRARDVVTEMRVRFNLVTDLFGAGDVEGAGELARESVERARRTGLTWQVHAVQLAMFVELVAYTRGDLSRREPAPDAPPGVASMLEAVGMYAAVARGDADAVDRGLALEPEWPRDGLVALHAGGTTIDALMREERVDEALALTDHVVDFLGRIWWEHFLGAIWIAAVALGGLADEAERRRLAGRDVSDLLERGDALLERAQDTAVHGKPRGGRLGPEGRAWLARARAEHARLHGRDDAALWRTALVEFDYGYAYEVARTRARLAAALVASGERAEATAEAAQALAAATAMGALPLAASVRDLARRARLDVPGVRHATTDVLTPREAEVLSLVAQGLTNGQIGERLFISTKTASVHVSNLLAKLGASGRTEAVSVAHQRGLMRQP